MKFKYFSILSLLLWIGCSSPNETNTIDNPEYKIYKTYFSNGKIKYSQSFINGHRYGFTIEYDSLGHTIYFADYINDTIDGTLYMITPEGIVNIKFFEMGVCKSIKILECSIDTLNHDTLDYKIYYRMKNDTAWYMGSVVCIRNERVIDSLTNFYTVNKEKDTISLDSQFNFLITPPSLYSSYKRKYRIELYLMDKKDSILLIDTLMEKNPYTKCELNYSVSGHHIGKNKIRGRVYIEYDSSIFNPYKIPLKDVLPVYINFVVRKN